MHAVSLGNKHLRLTMTLLVPGTMQRQTRQLPGPGHLSCWPGDQRTGLKPNHGLQEQAVCLAAVQPCGQHEPEHYVLLCSLKYSHQARTLTGLFFCFLSLEISPSQQQNELQHTLKDLPVLSDCLSPCQAPSKSPVQLRQGREQRSVLVETAWQSTPPASCSHMTTLVPLTQHILCIIRKSRNTAVTITSIGRSEWGGEGGGQCHHEIRKP